MSSCYYYPSDGISLFPIPYCLNGFYCPNTFMNNGLSGPVYCPPSQSCVFNRAIGEQCKDGFYGSQGVYEPLPCVRGKYCPTPLEMLDCPAGSYCPTGTVKPTQCSWFSYCADGSTAPLQFSGIVLTVLADLAIVLLYYVYFKRSKTLMKMKKTVSLNSTANFSKKFKQNLISSDIPIDFAVENLSFVTLTT